MDYSLLFIKAQFIDESLKFRRMPAMIFNNEEHILQIKKTDSFQVEDNSLNKEDHEFAKVITKESQLYNKGDINEFMSLDKQFKFKLGIIDFLTEYTYKKRLEKQANDLRFPSQ